MSTQHAPAPWRLNEDRDAVLDAHDHRIAELLIDHAAPHPVLRFGANGALLQSAPQLLSALESIEPEIHALTQSEQLSAFARTAFGIHLARVRHAISKAKGTP